MMSTLSGGGAAAGAVNFFSKLAGRRSAERSRLRRTEISAPGVGLGGDGPAGWRWKKAGSPPRKAAHDGLVADGRIVTAPPLGTRAWQSQNAVGVRGDGQSNCARRLRRTNTKIPSCGGGCRLWAALDGQRVQAVEQPCRRPEDAAIVQCTGQSHLRRLRRGLSEGPGSREGPGAKAHCARQPTHPATESRLKNGSSTLHNLTCVQTARGFNTRPL